MKNFPHAHHYLAMCNAPKFSKVVNNFWAEGDMGFESTSTEVNTCAGLGIKIPSKQVESIFLETFFLVAKSTDLSLGQFSLQSCQYFVNMAALKTCQNGHHKCSRTDLISVCYVLLYANKAKINTFYSVVSILMPCFKENALKMTLLLYT